MRHITPLQRKGIDITINALRKRFPYITGYKDDDRNNDYQGSHYILLKVSLLKLADYMGLEPNPWWVEHLPKEYPQGYETSAPGSFLLGLDWSSDITENPSYKLDREVDELVTGLYEYLPDDLTMFYDTESSFTPGEFYTYKVRLKSVSYIVKI